ncbi:hypothetical protein [Chitinophaga barathri]|uniref:Uncharacterized protein n=1 Tax=Chitinophaga barathri TaxID=1647451 RepID=A0A3N4MBG2_9BACT|nr:hypothetical protein [Chitinophaga barathri]RPD41172.1 hypothetical protein EG028_10845 [Chitinophaga barathri]
MFNYASDISFKGRLRIILLLVLSLVSCVSYILPDNIHQGYIHESLLNENESPEACKVSLGIEAAVKNKRAFSKKQPLYTAITAVYSTNGHEYARLASWIRPAYYIFLYRFSLF